ncbi:hypothetical protein K502DRAFT_352222 [Neoconidiobolus thromboides FSU 785]|nr:hypothetical protein K502DRAFT_352222 [Neoconidiobolus thromboides FSU 785]
MSSQPSKIHENMYSPIASVKENVGSVTDNHSLQAKDTGQKAEDPKSKGYVEGTTNNFAGSIKITLVPFQMIMPK